MVIAIPAESGDASFERLLAQHERQVARVAYRLLGRLDEAQDVTQEVFLRLYRNLGKIERGLNIAGWLYRVTVNVCRDVLRKRSRLVDLDRDFASGDPDPERTSEAGQRKRLVEKGMSKLTHKERECLTLCCIEGLATREAASILECAEVTVRSHISSARAKLKEFVERNRT